MTLLTSNFSLPENLALLFLSLYSIFDSEVALTVRLELISTWTRRTPKIHPGLIDIRCPGEVHGINIIEGHASHLSTWIDPVRRPAAE